MTPLPRRRLHRATFLAAGAYNIAWGTVSALHPAWFFHLARLDPPRYPEIFACLGMVVGLYGVLYLEVARAPERGWLIAAVGLTGKILGPIGFVTLLVGGEWPLRAGLLIATNDLIWWLPFGLYLYDVWCQARDASAKLVVPLKRVE